MPTGDQDLIVITGGPGAGKTTLITELHRAGFAVSPEAGRAIIREQVAIGGTALPWRDRNLFAELMLSWDLRSYRAARALAGPVFFDHAVPSVAGYLRLLGRQVPAHVDAAVAAFRYHRRVFVAPPWPEIYRTDEERRQTPEEARRTCEAMVQTYRAYGYELVELPRCELPGRVRFVLDRSGLSR